MPAFALATQRIATLLAAGVLLVSCAGRGGEDVGGSLTVDTSRLRTGDLIFREGPSPESHAVKLASGAQYSHVGLLCRDTLSQMWTVVHAVPDEDEPELVKQEPLALFLRSDRAVSACTIRISCPDSVADAAACYALGKVGTPFDTDYSLADTTRLYCTELVWQAYRHQGLDISRGQRHSVGAPGFTDSYIFPVDFIVHTENEHIEHVRSTER